MSGQFELALRKFAEKAGENANLVVRKTIFDISTRLVMRSPVGDAKYWKSKPPPGYVGGRFRGNWQYGLNVVDVTTTTKVDATGKVTIAKITNEVPENALGVTHYITNSLPYAQRLEDGWSRQAPQGMVRLTYVEFQQIIARAAASLP